MKPEVWDFISPILRENEGWAVFVMTPRGTNHAYDLMNKVKDDPKWFVQVLSVEDTKALPPEALEEARLEMPHDLFKQEYYCKFLDSGMGFFRRVDENTYKTEEYKPKELAFYQIGVDLAKYNDFTVITPLNLNDFHILKQDSFNQMDYNLQKARIENVYLKHNKGRIIIDSTGVGEPVFDDLVARGLNITPFRFNKTSRMDLLTNLQIQLEQDKIKIPDDQVLIDELKSMTYELNDNGTTVIKVPDGKHDDRIMSLALAVWEIPQTPIRGNILNQSFESGGVQPFYSEFGY
jgi:phage FluMu gp28-like protein